MDMAEVHCEHPFINKLNDSLIMCRYQPAQITKKFFSPQYPLHDNVTHLPAEELMHDFYLFDPGGPSNGFDSASVGSCLGTLRLFF